jgi:hypothetical protein
VLGPLQYRIVHWQYEAGQWLNSGYQPEVISQAEKNLIDSESWTFVRVLEDKIQGSKHE